MGLRARDRVAGGTRPLWGDDVREIRMRRLGELVVSGEVFGYQMLTW